MKYSRKKIQINEGRTITDGNIFFGGFPKILNEVVDLTPPSLMVSSDGGGFGGGQTPPTPGQGSPTPDINPDFPTMPGRPSWWFKGPTTPFGEDGEDPGKGMPDPRGGDPRWERWLKEWQQNNPPPVRQPGESLQDFERRREEYYRLKKAFEGWQRTYRYWYIRTYG